jgi:hypothetical protein
LGGGSCSDSGSNGGGGRDCGKTWEVIAALVTTETVVATAAEADASIPLSPNVPPRPVQRQVDKSGIDMWLS